MMFKFSNKGASDFLRGAIVNYIIFFIFLSVVISFGAGDYITSDVVSEPPIPSALTGDWLQDAWSSLTYAFNNLTYFFELMSLSVNLQVFTGIIMIPFFVILFMFILETMRGH